MGYKTGMLSLSLASQRTINECFSWIYFYYHNIHNYSCCFLWLYYFKKIVSFL